MYSELKVHIFMLCTEASIAFMCLQIGSARPGPFTIQTHPHFYCQVHFGRPLSSEHGSLRHGSRAKKLPTHMHRLESPPAEFSQDQRREVAKRSLDLRESASNDKVQCQEKEDKFLTWWAHAVSTGSKRKQG